MVIFIRFYLLLRFLVFNLINSVILFSNSLEWAITSPPKPHGFVSLPLQSFVGTSICLFPKPIKSINEMLDNKQNKFEDSREYNGPSDPETIKRLTETGYLARVFGGNTVETNQSENPYTIRNAIAAVRPRNAVELNLQQRILDRLPTIPAFNQNTVAVSTSTTVSSTPATSTTVSSTPETSTTVSSTTGPSTNTSSNISSNQTTTQPTPPIYPDNSSTSASSESSSSSNIKSHVDNKRRIDQTENESASGDSSSKKQRVATDNQSPIDYVLEKQSCEPTPFPGPDGEDG